MACLPRFRFRFRSRFSPFLLWEHNLFAIMETSVAVDWKLVTHMVIYTFQFRARRQSIIPSAAQVMAAEGAPQHLMYVFTSVWVGESVCVWRTQGNAKRKCRQYPNGSRWKFIENCAQIKFYVCLLFSFTMPASCAPLSLSGSFLTCFLWPAEMLFLFVLLFLDFCSSTCFPSCSQSDLHCCSHALSVAQRGIPLLLMFTIVDFNFS